MFSTSRALRLAGLGLAGLMVTGSSASAFAATASTTFQVTATVQATCQISASSLSFGTYAGTQTDASTTISVTCTNTTAYNVGLDAGTATGATVSTREMNGPSGALLAYALYRDSAHTQNWGTTIGSDTAAGTGSGSAQTLTVYGRVTGGHYVTPGSYVDTITATISY